MASTQLAPERRQKLNTQLLEVKKRLYAKSNDILEGCPPHVSKQRIMTTAYLAIRDNTDLLKCEIVSLCAAIAEAGQAGLEIGGIRDLCYLVPYKAKCQLIVGYKGLLELCHRSGQIKSISANLVHEGDRFRIIGGTEESIEHEPSTGESRGKAPVTHVYAIFRFINGGAQHECWTAAEINDHKEQNSPGWKTTDSPWQKHWGIMAKKTVIRSMINRGLIPMAVELATLAERHDTVNADAWSEAEIETVDAVADAGDEVAADAVATVALAQLKNDMEAAKSLTAIADVLSHGGSLEDGEFHDLESYAEQRREELRGSRGDREEKQAEKKT